jgi:hypothetical protein
MHTYNGLVKWKSFLALTYTYIEIITGNVLPLTSGKNTFVRWKTFTNDMLISWLSPVLYYQRLAEKTYLSSVILLSSDGPIYCSVTCISYTQQNWDYQWQEFLCMSLVYFICDYILFLVTSDMSAISLFLVGHEHELDIPLRRKMFSL